MKAYILILAVVLSGCASAMKGTWEQPGKDERQLGNDKAACRILGNQESNGAGWAVKQGIFNRYYSDCMESKGWRYQEES
jgi:uncharacterized protein YceK